MERRRWVEGVVVSGGWGLVGGGEVVEEEGGARRAEGGLAAAMAQKGQVWIGSGEGSGWGIGKLKSRIDKRGKIGGLGVVGFRG